MMGEEDVVDEAWELAVFALKGSAGVRALRAWLKGHDGRFQSDWPDAPPRFVEVAVAISQAQQLGWEFGRTCHAEDMREQLKKEIDDTRDDTRRHLRQWWKR